MLVVQHNCNRAYATGIAALETGLEIGAALVCLQELSIQGDWGHPGYTIYWPECGNCGNHQVVVAVRRGLSHALAIDTRTDLVNHPYIMVMDVWELAPGPQRKRLR
jgi:hypothetical protein